MERTNEPKQEFKPRIFDMERNPAFLRIYEQVRPYTMTSMERQFALFNSVEYIVNNKIRGDIVECGVWKGGSVMLILETLKLLGVSDRQVFLYDTFSGMSRPSDKDVRYNEVVAQEKWQSTQNGDINEWCYASLEEVSSNILKVGYPEKNLHYIVGRVEDTLPKSIPNKIALLRLDTDWYESTLHEMNHLYPRLRKGGVLLIDDYGCWKGARTAVDEYIKRKNSPFYLTESIILAAWLSNKQF